MSSRSFILGAALVSLTLAGCVPEHHPGDRVRVTAASAQRRAYLGERRSFDRDEYYQASLYPYYVWGSYDAPFYYGYGGSLPDYGWGDQNSPRERPGTIHWQRSSTRGYPRTRARAGYARVILHSRGGARAPQPPPASSRHRPRSTPRSKTAPGS